QQPSASDPEDGMNRDAAAKWIRRVSPTVARADLARFVNDRVKERLTGFTGNAVMKALFTPAPSDTVVPLSNPGTFTRQFIWRMKHVDRSNGQPLPLPPAELLYYHNMGFYLQTGQADASTLRTFFDRLGVRLNGVSVMDWGCRDCRVLRHFEPEAQSCDFWGVDQHGPSMEWAKENLSPPFRFVTCSAYPHLPFEDRTFDVIFALSVLTHIPWLADAWLMELRRILKPGGYGLLTIHDEHTWQFLRQDDAMREKFGFEEDDIARADTGELVIIDGPD